MNTLNPRLSELLSVYHSIANSNSVSLEAWVGDELVPFYYDNGTSITDERLLIDLQEKALVFENFAIVQRHVHELRQMARKKTVSEQEMATFLVDGYARLFPIIAQINTNVCLAFSPERIDECWRHRSGTMSAVSLRVSLTCARLSHFLTHWASAAFDYQVKLNNKLR